MVQGKIAMYGEDSIWQITKMNFVDLNLVARGLHISASCSYVEMQAFKFSVFVKVSKLHFMPNFLTV